MCTSFCVFSLLYMEKISQTSYIPVQVACSVLYPTLNSNWLKRLMELVSCENNHNRLCWRLCCLLRVTHPFNFMLFTQLLTAEWRVLKKSLYIFWTAYALGHSSKEQKKRKQTIGSNSSKPYTENVFSCCLFMLLKSLPKSEDRHESESNWVSSTDLHKQ